MQGQSHNIKTAKGSFENVEKLKKNIWEKQEQIRIAFMKKLRAGYVQ
jgi:hypothetical protein